MSATWIRHDVGARRDLKIIALKEMAGRDLYSYWWEFIEVLAEQENFKLNKKFMAAVSLDLGLPVEELRRLVAMAKECELLIEDDSHIWSAGLRKRMAKLESVRDADRKRKAPEPDSENFQNGKNRNPKISGLESSTLLYSTQIGSSQIKSNPATGGGGAVVEQVGAIPASANPPLPEADEYAPYRKYVEKYLCSPTEPPSPWEQDNLHIGAGKRPCRDFPLVWLTPTELCSVFKFYAEQIPDHDRRGIFKDCLQATQSDAQSYVSGGKPIGSYNAYARLTSWKLQDVVGARNSVKKLVGSLASSKSFVGARP